jgi:hypothetical protein
MDKDSARISGILVGVLIALCFWVIPPQQYYDSVPHGWVHTYCSHALIWIRLDKAENGGCHPGPISRVYMAYYQTGARYPLYWIILNIVPYTFPAIMGFLIIAALPERQQKTRLRISGNLVLGSLIIFMILFCACYIAFQ